MERSYKAFAVTFELRFPFPSMYFLVCSLSQLLRKNNRFLPVIWGTFLPCDIIVILTRYTCLYLLFFVTLLYFYLIMVPTQLVLFNNLSSLHVVLTSIVLWLIMRDHFNHSRQETWRWGRNEYEIYRGITWRYHHCVMYHCITIKICPMDIEDIKYHYLSEVYLVSFLFVTKIKLYLKPNKT